MRRDYGDEQGLGSHSEKLSGVEVSIDDDLPRVGFQPLWVIEFRRVTSGDNQ